jgi:hypothetical protein
MKRISKCILLLVFSIVTTSAFSQGINFQGVARSANGTIIASSNISLRLSIISKNVDATPEYIETKTVVTNAQGIFSVVVGDAANAVVTGNFKNIAWKDGIKFLKVEMDPAAGTNYINMGTTQLQYVPYSFYSLGVDAANVTGVLPIEKGGTGVVSLSDFKTALKLSNFDTTSLSMRIDERLTKADTVNLSKRIDERLTKADTVNLSKRIDEKLNKIDTIELSTRIDKKASINNPIFTGTATGVFKGDLTGNVTGNTSGTASNITGLLSVVNGGTGSKELTTNSVLLGNGTDALIKVAPGNTGNVLTSDGTTWKSLPLNQSNNSSTTSPERISRRALNLIYLKF